MKLDEALSRLKTTAGLTLRTADAMAILSVNKDHASHVLSRLAASGHLVRLKRGLWAHAGTEIDPLSVAEAIIAPFPGYVSLQTALYYHGMVSQVPDRTYCVSIARTRNVVTPIGSFSIHHVCGAFFFGYEVAGNATVKMATPEKALLDFLYLGPAKTRLFSALPELELPGRFSIMKCRRIIGRVKSQRRRTMLSRRFDEVMAGLV